MANVVLGTKPIEVLPNDFTGPLGIASVVVTDRDDTILDLDAKTIERKCLIGIFERSRRNNSATKAVFRLHISTIRPSRFPELCVESLRRVEILELRFSPIAEPHLAGCVAVGPVVAL